MEYVLLSLLAGVLLFIGILVTRDGQGRHKPRHERLGKILLGLGLCCGACVIVAAGSTLGQLIGNLPKGGRNADGSWDEGAGRLMYGLMTDDPLDCVQLWDYNDANFLSEGPQYYYMLTCPEEVDRLASNYAFNFDWFELEDLEGLVPPKGDTWFDTDSLYQEVWVLETVPEDPEVSPAVLYVNYDSTEAYFYYENEEGVF